jgi:hypothetical protein
MSAEYFRSAIYSALYRFLHIYLADDAIELLVNSVVEELDLLLGTGGERSEK